MLTRPTGLEGLVVLQPEVFEDERGSLVVSWSRSKFEEATGVSADFAQDNHSGSSENVLRGLHYQLPPRAQGKLVRVTSGAVFDVAVDLRRSSPTFGDWFGLELSADNRTQLWIPPGFAHGFLTLSSWCEVQYKLTAEYAPEYERVLRWDDPEVGIEWPLAAPPSMSERDAAAPKLAEVEAFS